MRRYIVFWIEKKRMAVSRETSKMLYLYGRKINLVK